MKRSILQVLIFAVLAMILAGPAQSAPTETNAYINCQVTITVSSNLLAVELSQTTWDLGNVAQGGIKDSWFGQTTHGKFWVRNAGDVTNTSIFIVATDSTNGAPIRPDIQVPPDPFRYAMAVATNISDVLPVWHTLNQDYLHSGKTAGLYMGTLMPGDYMLFDLRFYAGTQINGPSNFRVGAYATSGGTPY
jgi:hypothetical protein